MNRCQPCPTASRRQRARAAGLLRAALLVAIVAGRPVHAAPEGIERGTQVFTIEARDAETREPIAGALVSVRTTLEWLAGPYDPYAIEAIERHPGRFEARTDAQGRAVVEAVTLDRPYRFGWRITAAGYLSNQLLAQPKLPAGTDQHKVPLWDIARSTAAPYLYWMYREPRPQIELIVPAALRGPVLITTQQAGSLIQGAPGQRTFSFTVPASGHLQLGVAPLLAHGPMNAYIGRVRYDDGRELPSEPWHAVDDAFASDRAIGDPKLVGLRLVRRFASVQPETTHLGRELTVTRWLYVVGTHADAAAMAARLGARNPQVQPEDADILRRAREAGAN